MLIIDIWFSDADLDQDVLLILHLTGKMSDEQLKSMLPSLAGVLVQILNGLNRNTNIMIAERIIVIINNILRVFNTLFQQQDCDVSSFTSIYLIL